MIRGTGGWVVGVAAALALLTAPAVHSQVKPGEVPAPVALRFDIERYVVEGNSLLPPDEVDRLVAPFRGRQRDFGDVQRALEALEGAYRARGFAAVQVFLPEQDLERGQVVIRVIEARIRKVEIRGQKFFDEANLRASLPSLAEGTTPNANAIAKNLRLVNESPAKQVDVTLRAGQEQGEVDALVEVSDENPSKAFVTLDNTGTGQTGYYRLGFGYQHSNLFGSDHAITLQYVTSPDYPSRVGVYSVGYHFPLYGLGSSMDFFAGHSDVDAGTTQTPAGPLAFSGSGNVYGARYNQHLERFTGYDHKLVWGLDHRDYRNTCALGAFGAAGCGAAAASFKLTPVSLTYAGIWTLPSGRFAVSAGAIANAGGGAGGDTAALGLARFGAKSNYKIWRFGAAYAQAVESDWQVRARFDLQHTEEVLVPPEQFGIGGANSVRGFLERELANDRGYSGSLELHTPELAPRLGLDDWNLRAIGFYDFGHISRVNPLPGEQPNESISSVGVGLRISHQKSFSLRLDVARIVEPGGTRERGHWRGLFGTVWSF